MGRGLHALGEEVAWSLRPEQAYALSPDGTEPTLAPIDPQAVQPEE
jgi:hypothetical protein